MEQIKEQAMEGNEQIPRKSSKTLKRKWSNKQNG